MSCHYGRWLVLLDCGTFVVFLLIIMMMVIKLSLVMVAIGDGG